MPTKKQVRRRQKERRHEWEEVYVDSEGNVVEPPPEDDEESPAPRAAKRQQAARPAARARGRTIQPPSWRRVFKRGLIFAPLMFVTVYLLAPDSVGVPVMVQQTAFLLMIFLPFSYAMDALTYRMWRRRTGQAGAADKRT